MHTCSLSMFKNVVKEFYHRFLKILSGVWFEESDMYFDIQILGNVMPENLNVGDVMIPTFDLKRNLIRFLRIWISHAWLITRNSGRITFFFPKISLSEKCCFSFWAYPKYTGIPKHNTFKFEPTSFNSPKGILGRWLCLFYFILAICHFYQILDRLVFIFA